MKKSIRQFLTSLDRNIAPLYLAAFVMGLASIWLIALPYIVNRLGGSDLHVGFCFSLNMGSYTISCAIAAVVLDRFDLKRVTMIAAIGAAAIMLLMTAAVAFAGKGLTNPQALWIIDLAVVFMGMTGACFWPAQMASVSSGCEGQKLTRRLGIYNIAWSSGVVLAPLLGGYLVEIGSIWPLLSAVILTTLAFAAICSARPALPGETVPPSPPANRIPPVTNVPAHRWFRPMARVALAAAFVISGLLITQFALLIKIDLDFSESTFGLLTTLAALATTMIFLLMARTSFWQYNLPLFFGAQLLLAIAMIIIPTCKSLLPLAMAVVLIGIARAFTYSSQQYYGVSGATKRSRAMATHEALLAIGFVIGAFMGGAVSDHFHDRRMPYLFGLIVVLISLAIQFIIYLRLRRSALQEE